MAIFSKQIPDEIDDAIGKMSVVVTRQSDGGGGQQSVVKASMERSTDGQVVGKAGHTYLLADVGSYDPQTEILTIDIGFIRSDLPGRLGYS